jgi:hypothetical protein
MEAAVTCQTALGESASSCWEYWTLRDEEGNEVTVQTLCGQCEVVPEIAPEGELSSLTFNTQGSIC